MIAVLAYHKDGGCCKLFTIPRDFDIQGWSERKRKSLEFIGVIRLEVIELL